MKKIIFILSLVSLLLSCSNTSEDDLIEKEEAASNVTYTSDIKAIIDNNCIRCHSNPPVNGAPISLTTYSLVKQAVQNNNLLDRISREEGSAGAMPNGGPRLPQSSIDLVAQWLTDGLLEN